MATPMPTNRAHFTAREVVSATRGRALGTQPSEVVGVSTDTRTLQPGNLFVALRGDRFDGHLHLDAAAASGATLALVEAEGASACPIPCVVVDDTVRALGELAAWHRRRLPAKTVIGITGSVGKTTTKELVARCLEAMGHRVHATPGNLNNRIGLPMTVLAADASHAALVLEMGMNTPGEIEALTAIAQPTHGIVTRIAAVHTEGVGSIEGVAKEKSALLLGLPEDGVAISHTNDAEWLSPWLPRLHARSVVVGSAGAQVALLERQTLASGSTRLRLDVAGVGELDATLGLLGRGAAENALLAIALAANVDAASLPRALAALANATPSRGRGALLTTPRGATVMDDSYNASRASVVNALEVASELAQSRSGRVLAALGDMLELGALEHDEHLAVGEAVARLGVSALVTVGERMRIAANEARELACDFVLEATSPTHAASMLRSMAREGDVIVVKGSRSMGMEAVVEALLAPPTVHPPGGA